MLLQICLDLQQSEASFLRYAICLVSCSFLSLSPRFFFLKMSPHFLEISALSVGSPVIESDK